MHGGVSTASDFDNTSLQIRFADKVQWGSLYLVSDICWSLIRHLGSSLQWLLPQVSPIQYFAGWLAGCLIRPGVL